MRGRKPKPLALRIAEGDTRKVGIRKLQALADSEPKAARGLPECPEHLKSREKAAWAFLSEEIAAMGLAFRPDAIMLEGLCVMYARAVKADEFVRREGLTIEVSVVNRDGTQIRKEMRTNPAVFMSAAAWKMVHSFGSDFGLNPVSRTRLTIESTDDDDEFQGLLNMPRTKREEVQ